MKKKLLLVLLAMVFLVACNKTEPIPLEGLDLDSEQVVKKEMLTKDINMVYILQPTCPQCEVESELLERVYKDYPDINFVGLGIGTSVEDVKAGVEDWGLTFKNYKITDGFYEVLKKLTDKTPSVFYLDKEGNEIKEREIGYTLSTEERDQAELELREKIDKFLKENH